MRASFSAFPRALSRALSRLAPQTLFGRLVLVLLAGLCAALAVTVYINSTERDQLLYRAGGMRLAQQIADIVDLLDTVGPAERRKVVAIFDAPPLAVSLEREPITEAQQAEGFQGTVFAAMLKYAVGEDRKITVVRRAPSDIPRPRPGWDRRPWENGPPEGPEPHRMRGKGRPVFAGGGPSFLVQVPLRDGTLVTFDSVVASQDAPVPLRLALTLGVLILSVIALSLVAVRWATAPLATLANAAEALGADINRPPLPEHGPVEVKRAAKAFNAMQQRLSRFISERTRVLSAISHDLKTPITRLRLRSELLEDEALRAKFEKDLDEMQSMVAQALEFMRDASAGEPVQPIDVMALLESMQSDFLETGHEVRLVGTTAYPYPGRPLGLRRCLTNLVDNAIRYGRRATIEVRDSPRELVLFIRDEGPGLPQEQLELAFEPFFRGEQSRSRETGGTGLGLSIARNIARTHGGDVALANRPEGGLEARLSLVRSTAAA